MSDEARRWARPVDVGLPERVASASIVVVADITARDDRTIRVENIELLKGTTPPHMSLQATAQPGRGVIGLDDADPPNVLFLSEEPTVVRAVRRLVAGLPAIERAPDPPENATLIAASNVVVFGEQLGTHDPTTTVVDVIEVLSGALDERRVRVLRGKPLRPEPPGGAWQFRPDRYPGTFFLRREIDGYHVISSMPPEVIERRFVSASLASTGDSQDGLGKS